MTKEGSTKIVNFMTPWVGVLMLGFPYKSYSKNAFKFISLKIFFSTLRH